MPDTKVAKTALAAAYGGVMGPELAGREYAGHLTDADLRLLASVAAGPARTGRAAPQDVSVRRPGTVGAWGNGPGPGSCQIGRPLFDSPRPETSGLGRGRFWRVANYPAKDLE